MRLEIRKYLFDIVEAANGIEHYNSGLEHHDYLNNGMVRAATERKFEIVGEALSRIDRIDATVLERVSEYQRIIGFRNVIAHG
jgi:uncharacterized protein with HEPN domain